ncbi:MAG: NADH:ubiquinone reductase (Na(+)-transporting) subunit F [Verrucomicrobia bacterium]|nr:NADH:ubiquinone reductase (Na(+)-transporting) subunit F [Verrucomicrobiota bacterium]
MNDTCKITLNGGRRVLNVAPGRPLLATLAAENIFMPSACGGKGACATCLCRLRGQSGPLTPNENALVKEQDRANGYRLSCQVPVSGDLDVEIPEAAFSARRIACTVVSNRSVATFIRELVLALPTDEALPFRAGSYAQIDIPPYSLRFADFDLPPEHRADWEKQGFGQLQAQNLDPTFRAYSMANPPSDSNRIMLNVRISTPPAARLSAPAGIASSYLFSLKPGDPVTVRGPHGDFFIKDTDREMLYIGGGAGMAPLRSHLLDLFQARHTSRKVTFWYGARSKREIFYDTEFQELARAHANFAFEIALSEPQPEDAWSGPTGMIHQAVLDRFLKDHPDPKAIEYYLCGPPMMIRSVRKMLATLGVEPDMIAFDAF